MSSGFKVAAATTRVVEWFYDSPYPALVETAHDAGALTGWQVGSLSDARLACDAGCDYIVVQGVEAGGHVAGRQSLWSLLPRVRDQVECPIVAAGGPGTAGAVAAAFTVGADVVRIGTRFVAAIEADAHPDYVNLSSTPPPPTPSSPPPSPPCGPTPPTASCGAPPPEPASSPATPSARSPWPRAPSPSPGCHPSPRPPGSSGTPDAMPLYAGHSVDSVTHTQPAADIVTELLDGAELLLGRPWRDH